MLTDQLEAFSSGIKSGVGRIALALLAVATAFGICGLCAGWGLDHFEVWTYSGAIAAWWWTVNRGWGFLGWACFLAMLGFLWGFVMDWQAKESFFIGFSAAVAFSSPVTFDEFRWVPALGIYFGLSFCYWVLPPVVARVFDRKD